MRIIGVTGGIGSGKSTVSRILADLGAKVVDADQIARKVVAKGEKALDELVAYFGSEILDERGELDRKKLGNMVFGNAEKLEYLNRVTHKYIAERMLEEVNRYRQDKNTELVVLDVPIPVDHGFLDVVDTVWVVSSDRETRVKRIMDRSGLTREEAVSRINSQMKEEEYLKIADETINNNGNIELLEKTVVKLLFRSN